jgi:hypothetical protein
MFAQNKFPEWGGLSEESVSFEVGFRRDLVQGFWEKHSV